MIQMFHGGCYDCTQQDEHGTEFCYDCCYFDSKWDKPNLNNRPPTDDLKDLAEKNYPELEEAAKADQEKAIAIIEAMDKLYKETWDDKPTTDR